MPIIDRRGAAIISIIVVTLALAVAIPPFIDSVGDRSERSVTQTEGDEIGLTGHLSADLTWVQSGQVVTTLESIHTTDTDFNGATTLENVTVEGSGDAGRVTMDTGGSQLEESFEDQAADSGVPDGWTSESSGGSTSITTSQASDGTQSVAMSDPAGGANERISHSVTSTTSDVSFSVYQVSGTNQQLRLYESGTRVAIVGMRNGDLYYFDGSWNVISTTPNTGEWVNVTITDFDPSANTYSVQWGAGPDSDTSTGLSMENGASAGYDEIYLVSDGSNGYFDDIIVGGADIDRAIYVSQTHQVDGSTTAFSNITLSNTNATVTWLADSDNDGTFETTVDETLYVTSGNKTADLSGDDSTAYRANVTFQRTGDSPSARLDDEGILFDETESTGINVTLIDSETGETVETGNINQSEERTFVIGGEDVTITNQNVLSNDRSLITYEYPTYYGMGSGVKAVMSNSPLIALALGFIIVVLGLYYGRGV